MKKLKFISSDSNQKQFALIVKQRVNNYFTANGISPKGDYRMHLKAAIMILMYLGPFFLLVFSNVNIMTSLLLVVLMGFGEAGIGMSVMHDGAHGAVSESKWVNRMYASTMYLLGSNTLNWKIQHNTLHHTFTNIYGFDQDIETKAVIRLCEHAPVKKWHRFQHIYAFFLYGLMTLSKLATDFIQLLEYIRAGFIKELHLNPRKEMIKLTISKMLYLLLFIGVPVLISPFTWWQVLIGFSIMHITAGMIMSTVFQMAHVVEGTEQPVPPKNGIISKEWAVHELNTTSDFARNNLFLNWYVGGLNFQIEHHLFRNICHMHYRKIAPIVDQTAREFGFIYNLKPSFLKALISHVRRLKVLGTASK